MTIVNDACTIVQASFTIVTYDRQNIFIIQATGEFNADKLLCQMNNLKEQLALGHWLFNSSAPMITNTTLFMVGCLLCRKEVLPPGSSCNVTGSSLLAPLSSTSYPGLQKAGRPMTILYSYKKFSFSTFPFKCFLWPHPQRERYPITIYRFLLQWNLSNSSSPS